jgi:diamine N-acetyltransferase
MSVVQVVGLDAGNIEDVLAVSAAPGQEAYVRPVAWYVALSTYERVWTPVTFLVDSEVVGFAQWAFDPADGMYCIGGVVIDAARQGQGLGRHAMSALVDSLRERPDCGPIALSVDVDNERARALYATMGFAETGDEIDGELVMVLPAVDADRGQQRPD